MSIFSHDPIPLAETREAFAAPTDRRPRMPEPLPVRLVTVDDAHLLAGARSEPDLDAFYVGILGFEREPGEATLAYRAENFRLIFKMMEPPVIHDGMRPLGIDVLSLFEAEQKLIDAEIDYVRQKALMPGLESLLLQDPAGNWIELTASPAIR